MSADWEAPGLGSLECTLFVYVDWIFEMERVAGLVEASRVILEVTSERDEIKEVRSGNWHACERRTGSVCLLLPARRIGHLRRLALAVIIIIHGNERE